MNLTSQEIRATFSLAAILSIRLLGLFMILPIFTLYANKFTGSTPALMGVALGIYGLTQASLQIPFGTLSDKWGRKPIIAIGLIIFIIGSIIAALSHHIYAIILGRALQGAGAIGSTLIALIADFTRIEHRTKAMAIMGITIGLSFMLAMVLGPFLNHWIHLSGIFWVTTGLGLLALLILFTVVPAAPKPVVHPEAEPLAKLFLKVLREKNLIIYNLSIACLHIILTATFIGIPLVLTQQLRIPQTQQSSFYLTIVVISFFAMLPIIIYMEKQQKTRFIFILSIIGLGLAQILFWKFSHSLFILLFGLLLLFTAFNVLEATLPSQVSKLAQLHNRGTAMGIYSTCQFLGIFIGGSLGGLALQHFGLAGVFIFALIIAILWGILIFSRLLA